MSCLPGCPEELKVQMQMCHTSILGLLIYFCLKHICIFLRRRLSKLKIKK